MTIPKHYLPMLASTALRPFNDPEWQFEVKWYGLAEELPNGSMMQ